MLWKIQNLAPTALDERPQVIVPKAQRGANLPSIFRPVVDARDAAAVTAEMIQNRFDMVRLDVAVFDHPSRDRSANIVRPPACALALELEPLPERL